jgi:hypothetical protein
MIDLLRSNMITRRFAGIARHFAGSVPVAVSGAIATGEEWRRRFFDERPEGRDFKIIKWLQ